MTRRLSLRPRRSVSRAVVLGVAAVAATLVAWPALAQDISINFGQGTTVTERAVQLVALLTVLSLAPSIVVMVTSFTRIVVVLSLLRSAIGLQTAPPNTVMISLSLFLTAFIMAPTLEQSWTQGVQPYVEGNLEEMEAFDRTVKPLHDFMSRHVRPQDVKLMMDLSRAKTVEKVEDVPLKALVPAFMISELRRAFEIGFLIYLPFIIIDLVIASVLMSMGMMMIPPAQIALPFKLIFFVLVDGWYMIVGSLVQSFGPG